MPSSEKPSYDVVIIGGGPAGSAAAITLARAGRRVLLAEAVASARFKAGESLPPSAFPLLRDLGIAPLVAGAGHLPCPGIVSAWGSEEVAERDFIRELHGSGWHLDRPRFDADLRKAAATAGAELRLDCAFGRWRRGTKAGTWDLHFTIRGETFEVTTPWMVDATGRRALIASHYGGATSRDDGLVAFCAVMPAAHAVADQRTLIESMEDGWWYSVLLPDGRRLVAGFTDEDLTAAGDLASAEGFLARLRATRHVRHTVAETSAAMIERVRRFPAGSTSRTGFAGHGWLAVGDATLAFDPLSSQGIFHALYTGLRGAQTILATDAGDQAALPRWNDRIRAVRAAYHRHLAECYGAETRWPGAPFWDRRRTATSFLSGHSLPFVSAQPAALP